MESWCKYWCKECGKPNWISFGDTSDQTGYDPEGYRCWNCGYCHPFSDDDEFESDDEDSVEDLRYEDGLEKPT